MEGSGPAVPPPPPPPPRPFNDSNHPSNSLQPSAPPPGSRRAPVPKAPEIDREKTCPLLLRVFPKVGGVHELGEYDLREGRVPAGELQIYTWRDASLRELTELVKEVQPAARRREARLQFALVYPDRQGRLTRRPLGAVHAAPGKRSEAERHTLHSLQFQTGDFMDVAILTS